MGCSIGRLLCTLCNAYSAKGIGIDLQKSLTDQASALTPQRTSGIHAKVHNLDWSGRAFESYLRTTSFLYHEDSIQHCRAYYTGKSKTQRAAAQKPLPSQNHTATPVSSQSL